MKTIYKILWLLEKILQELRYQSYLRECIIDSTEIIYTKRGYKNGNNE